MPSTDSNAFQFGTYTQDATLHVPDSALPSYKETYPWSSFGYFKAIDTSGVESLENQGVIFKSIDTSGVESLESRGVTFMSTGGIITISGLHTNERVYFYTALGTPLGSTTAIDGTATFSATSGTIVVAKIGKESMKIVVR